MAKILPELYRLIKRAKGDNTGSINIDFNIIKICVQILTSLLISVSPPKCKCGE